MAVGSAVYVKTLDRMSKGATPQSPKFTSFSLHDQQVAYYGLEVDSQALVGRDRI
jgi:hypothetical protein